MRLKLFRSLWGCKEALSGKKSISNAQIFSEIRKTNLFSGIEASLYDFGGSDVQKRTEFKRLLSEHDFECILGLYSSWQDYDPASSHLDLYKAVPVQVDQLLRQLEVAKREFEPCLINVHAGADSWSDKEAVEFFSALEKQLNHSERQIIGFETHRSRIFGSPFMTLRMIEQFDWIRLTADFSHWNVVAERMLGICIPHEVNPEDDLQIRGLNENELLEYESRMLEKIASRVIHVHARIGSAQRAQLPEITEREFKDEIDAHWNFWRMVWKQRDAEGRKWMSMTPEYGPYPYADQNIDAEGKERHVWELTNSAAKQLIREFE